MLLDGQEKGSYTIDLRPTISMPVFSLNLTSEDREAQGLRRPAVPPGDVGAINRDEINEVAFFGLGEPKQYTAFSPEPDFITDEWKQHYAQFDPDLAGKLLDEVGMADTDGDGFRELPMVTSWCWTFGSPPRECPARWSSSWRSTGPMPGYRRRSRR